MQAVPLRLRLRLGAAVAVLLSAAAIVSAGAAGAPVTDQFSPDGAKVLVVGDSLAVGLEPYLGDMLAGDDVVWDAKTGRTTPQGLVQLRARLAEVTPSVVVVSLGTNDGPDGPRFAARIRKALAAIPARSCVVWVDIYRPARKGAYAALNDTLRTEAARDHRVVLVDWLRAVKEGKV